MSAKLDNVILEAVKFRNAAKQDYIGASAEDLFKAIDAADLLPGEPIFTVRGKDLVASSTVNYWLIKAEQVGAQGETLEEVRRKRQAIDDWQNDIKNLRHVKVPT